MLEVLCARALESGDVEAAYRLSDRRCRIRPLPDAHCYVLRAEALHRMGERAAAVADLAMALEIAPDDIAANRRLLNWGKARQRIAAARTLISVEHDMRIVRQAIAVLRKAGQTAFSGVRVHEGSIEGWAAWQGAGLIRIAIAGETDRVETRLDADPRHPLSAELGNAVGFHLPRPPAQAAQFVSVTRDRDVLVSLRTTHPAGQGVQKSPATRAPVDVVPQVTVIVPVYADYHATRACLESLLDQIEGSARYTAVVVNDASPDPHIRDLLDGLDGRRNLAILTNAQNLGFVGAINRGLDAVLSGDVVLLNADTIVPAGFIERLSAAARSAPDIGTVTPLSNNGEFTSFPVPNRSNAAGDAATVAQLDDIAARVNTGGIVDIPNGIGFCLYVTRACLDAVGALSESYHRGYLEDVDFCLRARQHGFRNVCATSVYVGHAGSRSFRAQKRSLVVRNLAVIEQRFPTYRTECADFVLADPLKAARRAIELCLPSAHRHGTLLVSAGGVAAEVARERAGQLLADALPAVFILELRRGPEGAIAELRDAADGIPQSLAFRLPSEMEGMRQFLQGAELARIEFLDLAAIPRDVIDLLLELAIPYDLFMTHDGLASTVTNGKREAAQRDHAAPERLFLRNVVARAYRVLAPDAQAAAVASTLALRRTVTRLDTATVSMPHLASSHAPAARLGLVPIRGGAQEHRFMHGVIAGLRRAMPGLDIIVAGSTLDDHELFRTGAFVTGPIDADEFADVFRRHRLERVFCCLLRPLFGHPVVSATTAAALPVAYIDWSRGECAVRAGDLPLDSQQLITTGVVEQLVPWLQGAQSA